MGYDLLSVDTLVATTMDTPAPMISRWRTA
jgi:hypothetical protein